ncbi:Uncharacterised protein [Mycobacterium tuberculosis]|uniref:Uncharacterized protein n=1 Tax=Mycobacterium tuberculosis TaxID=1773 RepID=A0A654U5T6_MYCTX|nr:Uncharacterised protein [Mycobacterium tuberculosis]CNV67252.1 Uncharacterised protein [Mycobacterium tuberculosis]CNW01648.1 Uncharacterised protein [Mycobacterium tuberculosis]
MALSYVVTEMAGDAVGDNCGLGFGEHGSLGQRFAIRQRQHGRIADGPHVVGASGQGARVHGYPPGFAETR